MYKKILLVSALLITVGFGTAFALTSADIDLLVSIGVISAEKGAMVKATMLGTTPAPAPEPVVNYGQIQSCISISRNLALGSRDTASNSDVSNLQLLLQGAGYLDADPTGFFGYKTLSAVKKFQVANSIESSGYVGSLTRGALNKLCGTAENVTIVPVSEISKVDVAIINNSIVGSNGDASLDISIKGYPSNKQIYKWLLNYNCVSGLVIDNGPGRYICDGKESNQKTNTYYSSEYFDVTKDLKIMTLSAKNSGMTTAQWNLNLVAYDSVGNVLGGDKDATSIPPANSTSTPITNINVGLSADSPSVVAVEEGVLSADLIRLDFTNNSVNQATVVNLSLQMLGIYSDSSLSNISLFEGNTKIASATSVSSGKFMFNVPSGIFTIPSGVIKRLTIRSGISSGTSGQSFRISLTSLAASAPTNGLPISGPLISINKNTGEAPYISSVSSETTENDIIVKVSGSGLGNATVKLLDSAGGDYSSRIISKDLSVGSMEPELRLRVLTIPSTYQIYVTNSAGNKSNTVKFDIKSYFVKGNDPNYPFYIGWDKRSGNEKTNTSNTFDNPRFKVNDLREYVVAGDQTTVNNWCKIVGKALGKTYISGTYQSHTNGLTEPRAYLDSDGGYTLKTISNTTYISSITCNTGAVIGSEKPSAKIIGTPGLKLEYNAYGKEVNLGSSFVLDVKGGSDGVRVYPHTFNVRFNGSQSSDMARSQANRLIEDNSGRTITDYYDIPANKEVRLQVLTTAKANELFAGQYYANIASGVGYKLTDVSTKVDIVIAPENNLSNKVTIIGELSPYINSVRQEGDLIVIEGVRLSEATLSSINCNSDGIIGVVQQSVSSNILKYKLSRSVANEQYCYFQLDSNNGKSNNAGVNVKTMPVEVASVLLLSPNGGEALKVGDTYNISWSSKGGAVGKNVQIGIVDVRYDTEGGDRREHTIAFSIPNTGSYQWTVPANIDTMDLTVTDSAVYKISLYSTIPSEIGIADASDTTFSIIKPVTATTINLSEKFPKEVTGSCLKTEYVRAVTLPAFSKAVKVVAATDVKGDDYLRINGVKVGTFYTYRDCGDSRQVGNVIKAGTILTRIPAGTPVVIEVVDSVGFESSASGTLLFEDDLPTANIADVSMASVSLTWDDIVLLLKVLKK